jgi:hypothetical protein
VNPGYYHAYDPNNLKEGRTFLQQAEIDAKMQNAEHVEVNTKGKIKCP